MHGRGGDGASEGGDGGAVVDGGWVDAAHHLEAEQHADHGGAGGSRGRRATLVVGPLGDGDVDALPRRRVAAGEVLTGALVAGGVRPELVLEPDPAVVAGGRLGDVAPQRGQAVVEGVGGHQLGA